MNLDKYTIHPTKYHKDRVNNLTGKRFGRLLVLGLLVKKVVKYGKSKTAWLCKCSCSSVCVVDSNTQLTSGNTKSCGCFRKDNTGNFATKHGQARPGKITMKYSMWNSAKQRAAKNQLGFNIELSDIFIPTFCPVLGTKLEKSCSKVPSANSPSLDRIIPSLGYVKGNIKVISHRANALKNNASLEELNKLCSWLAAQLGEPLTA
jgi:hypothetical protein